MICPSDHGFAVAGAGPIREIMMVLEEPSGAWSKATK
jgi:hypothetical protein